MGKPRANKKKNPRKAKKKEELLCDTCFKTFGTRQILVRHVKGHAKEKINYICELCGRGFSQPHYLIWHMGHAHPGQPFRDPGLPKDTSSVDPKNVTDVRANEPGGAAQNTETPGQLIIKEECDDNDRPKGQINKHSILKCEFCPSRFDEMDFWIAHQSTHAEANPFKCNMCLEPCASQDIMIDHYIATHIGQEPISCRLCPEMFFSDETRKIHAEIHGDKVYDCDLCEESFASKQELVEHRKSHKKNQRNQCSVCDKRFMQRSTVTRHINKFHNGKGKIISHGDSDEDEESTGSSSSDATSSDANSSDASSSESDD